MAWEDVPADVDNFFKTGELPSNANANDTPTETASSETTHDDGAASKTAERVEETTSTSDVVHTKEESSQPAPSNPYADELIRQQKDTLDKLTKQLSDLQTAQRQKEEEANKPVAPDPEKDPLGYLTFQINQVGEQVKAMQEAQTRTTKETAEQTQMRQFFDGVNSQIEAFKKTQPDYLDAYKHLVDLRTEDYKLRGMSPDQISQAIGREEMEILNGAVSQRKNPAEVVYALAKKYGYQQKSTTDVPPEKKVESKLDTIKKGLETTGAQRGAPPSQYSTEAVKEMSNAQLHDAVENHWDEMFGRSGNKGIF